MSSPIVEEENSHETPEENFQFDNLCKNVQDVSLEDKTSIENDEVFNLSKDFILIRVNYVNLRKFAYFGKFTIFKVVAHKLSTVWNANLIAIVNNGCLVEIGSHNDLINKTNGHYAKMAKICDDEEKNPETHVSSIRRSSGGGLIVGRSSPTVFASPLPVIDGLQPITHPPLSYSCWLSATYPCPDHWWHDLCFLC
ncbi:hypothetical protein CUMW_133190 [Citrus unshiu]|nr:hypothetical protein CUMW_133190 [Citrus unshiu]